MSYIPVLALRNQAAILGIELSDEQLEQCDQYARLVIEANEEMNLTRITEPEEMVIQHFLDSLTCVAAWDIPQGGSVIDIGTGAGFPGVPIKIARPDLTVVMLDSTLKKVEFIRGAVAKMGLTGVQVLCLRAEEAGQDARYREKFDATTARAVAQLPIIAELCLPFLKIGGVMLAQKGADILGEMVATGKIVGRLGGAINEPRLFVLSGVTDPRKIVIVKKLRPTPPEFPRSYSEIVKGFPIVDMRKALEPAPSQSPRPFSGGPAGRPPGRPSGPSSGSSYGRPPGRPSGPSSGPSSGPPHGRPPGRPSGPSFGPSSGRPPGRPSGPSSGPSRPPMRPRRPEK